jgi:phenylalanyl-tRNA synthetase beta chain
MKFSEAWLREWVNPALTTEQLVAQLTMAGLEVDGVELAAPAFNNVVVVEILSATQHPDAEKLRVCQVSNGKEQVQIVCGAANARAGIRVPLAMIGAVLPGDLAIKQAKLRGVESFGMLCGASELGLPDVVDGLLELPQDAPVGKDLREYLQLNDKIIEVGLTPNRGDCLSILGMAREVSVLNVAALKVVDTAAVAPVIDDTFAVSVEAKADCPRYVGRVIRNIDISRPTPAWMQERLRRGGIRSIDAVVDVTNYVMLELGQPMHAFDLDNLSGGIVVRGARAGETLTLLNGQQLELQAGNLVIADQQKVLALAGIMGGQQSGVSATTRHLFLESAFFTPLNLAGRARGYGLHTDSSHRFERGVDAQLQRSAIERATALLLSICGGELGPVTEIASASDLPVVAPIRLRRARISQLLGFEIADAEVERILSALGMQIAAQPDGWAVQVPSFRFDVAIEADLLEELARIYGYNRLPVSYPAAPGELQASPERVTPTLLMRRHMQALGYQEAITYSFIDPKWQKDFDPSLAPVALTNPISADMSVMRTSLVPALVAAVKYNQNRQQPRVRLFELGLRFVPGEGGLRQENMIAGVICGGRGPEGWADKTPVADFYDIKGDVEALLAGCGCSGRATFEAARRDGLHPGQAASILIDGEVAGYMGALHPQLAKAWDVTASVYVFELLIAPISERKVPHFKELSKFPEVRRDLAIIIGQDVAVASIIAAATEAAGDLLTELVVFDVYTGKGIDPGHKSIAFGLTFQHPQRTLNDEDVNVAVNAVISVLQTQFEASLRT